MGIPESSEKRRALEADRLERELEIEKRAHAEAVKLLSSGEALRQEYVLKFALLTADVSSLKKKINQVIPYVLGTISTGNRVDVIGSNWTQIHRGRADSSECLLRELLDLAKEGT